MIMVTSDMEEFSFPKWYPKFVSSSIESIVIPIPNNVLQYLQEGSLILPQEAVCSTNHDSPLRQQNYSVDWSIAADDTPELEQPTFPTFSAKLKDALNTLGGEVFIKLNWSAPTDSAWITTNKTLKCTGLEDIYLLLKSSEFIARDLSYTFKISSLSLESNYCVVLKRWTDMHPGCEFRCFVMEDTLIAISQRDCGAYYSHINQSKGDIMKDIIRFFKRRIKKKFSPSNYTFDVVWQERDNIILLDFNPLVERVTKTLLFSWDELEQMSSALKCKSTTSMDKTSEVLLMNREEEEAREQHASNSEPEFRFLGEDPGIQPNRCQHFGVPYEVHNLCTSRRNLSLMGYLLEEVQKQQADEDNQLELQTINAMLDEIHF